MRSLFLCLTIAGLAQASPGDLRTLSKVPARFERDGERTFTGRGFGYKVSLSPSGYALSIPEHGGERTVRVSIAGARSNVVPQAEAPLSVRISYFHGANPKSWRTGVQSFARVRYPDVVPGADLVYYGTGDNFEFDLALHTGFDAAAIRLRYEGQDALSLDEEGRLHIAAGTQQLVQPLPAVYQKMGDSLQLVSGAYIVEGSTVRFELGPYDRTRPLIIDPVVLYTGFFGGLGTDNILAVRRDPQGLLYVAGNSRSIDLPVTDSTFQSTNAGDQDVFLMKLDPSADSPILFLTYLGGLNTDELKAMALAPDGTVYLTGTTGSTDFPTKNASQSIQGGDKDAFIARLDPSKTGTDILVFSTFYGGSGPDVSNAIALDSTGNAYIAGYSGSGNLTMNGNPVQGSNQGGWDAFVAIFDPSGNLNWSTYLGGDKTDQAQAIAVAPDGTVVIAGNTTSASFPIAGNSFDTTYHAGGGDGFIARMKINAGLDGLRYGTFLGGNGAEDLRNIAFTADGKLVVTGSTSSTDFPVGQAPIQATRRGETDVFVSLFDLDKPDRSALLYSTYLGGTAAELPYALKIDTDGTILITGYTYSQNFPVTPSAYQAQTAGAPDAFFTRLDLTRPGAAGLLYSSYLGGPQVDTGYAIESDSKGVLYVAGNTNSRRFPGSSTVTRDSYPGDYDAFLFIVQPCTVTLSQSSASIDATGGDSFTFQVTTGSDCSWNASAGASWVSITGGATGRGNGTVTYSVSPNDGADPRSTQIVVADQKLAVNQGGNQ